MSDLGDCVYIINHLGMDSGGIPRCITRVKVLPHEGEGIKTVRVIGGTGPGVTDVYVVKEDADECIKIANPDTLPQHIQNYFQVFGIQWKPYF
jgi:hypothetical protein